MPTSFRPLGDNDVCTGLRGLACLRHSLYLADQSRTNSAYSGRERPRIAERKHDGSWSVCKSTLKDLGALSKTPSDKAAANPGIARALPFSIDPVAVAIPAANQSAPTCLANCSSKPATGHEVHRGEHYWVFNPECLRQTILN
jgi:hypothetical protein